MLFPRSTQRRWPSESRSPLGATVRARSFITQEQPQTPLWPTSGCTRATDISARAFVDLRSGRRADRQSAATRRGGTRLVRGYPLRESHRDRRSPRPEGVIVGLGRSDHVRQITASRLLGDTLPGRGRLASNRSYRNFPPTRRPLRFGNFLPAHLTPPALAGLWVTEAESGTAARKIRKRPAMNETPIQITGNLTTDPELRYTPSGRAVTNLRVAANPRRYDRQSGQWVDGTTNYFDVEVWVGPENVAESLTKGDRVIIFGNLRTQTWTPEGADKARSKLVVVADRGRSQSPLRHRQAGEDGSCRRRPRHRRGVVLTTAKGGRVVPGRPLAVSTVLEEYSWLRRCRARLPYSLGHRRHRRMHSRLGVRCLSQQGHHYAHSSD